MSNHNKLKPCLFCGSDDATTVVSPSAYVRCDDCLAEGPWVDPEGISPDDLECAAKMAEEQWNRRASPWISVDERLPDKLDDYFVVCTDQQITKCTFDPSRQKWMFICVGVTHWMPLPELPEDV